MSADNFTPEQIAADRQINGKATTEQLEVYPDTCGVAGCDEHNVRGLAAGNHGMFEHKGDAEFFVNARTRFPLALDEIERLQAKLADLTADVLFDVDAVGYYGENTESAMQCWREKSQILQAENAAMSEALASLLRWMRGLRPTGAGSPGPLFTAGMGMIAEACEKKADEVGATLSDAVARGKKLLELERRDSPVVVRAERLRYACSACDVAVDLHNKLCRNCGRKLAWQ